MIPELARVIIFLNPGAQSRDHQANLLGGQHFVKTGLFNVENLALEREDCLIAPVSPLFG
jgi:hypothetical protein